MATADIISYYGKLLILQYLGKPKAFATIKALVEPVIMDQIPVQVQNAFDIDTAVGVQLDTIGKYAGASRSGILSTGVVTLSDDDYRILIKFAIISNNSGSSLSTIQDLLFTYFPNQIVLTDFKNMQMSYLIDTNLGSQDLLSLLVFQGLLPRPMAVSISAAGVPDLGILFSFSTYDLLSTGSPFNTYSAYNLNFPWLSYESFVPI